MTGWAYFFVQRKRFQKILRIMLPVLAVITLLVCLAGHASIRNTMDQNRMKVNVGLCGDTSSPILSMGISFLTAFDDAQYLVNLLPMEEDKAREMLRAEKLSAYVVIPEGFEEAVNYNQDDKPLRYYTARGQKDLSSLLMDRVAESISRMIVSSNAGVLAYGKALSEAASYDDVMVEVLFVKDLELIMKRNQLLSYEELGVSGGAGTLIYYVLCICLFLLLLFSFAAAPFFYRREPAFMRFASAKGIYAEKQILLEFLAYLLMGLIWWGCLCIGFGFMLLQYMTARDFMILMIMLLGAMVTFFSMHLFLYEVLNGIVAQLSGQFIIYIFMAFVSGYFYPRDLLPEFMQKFSRTMPTGFCLDALLAAYSGRFALPEVFCMIFVTFAFMLGAMLFRSEHIRGRDLD